MYIFIIIFQELRHIKKRYLKNVKCVLNSEVLEVHYNENNFPSPMEVGFIARWLSIDPLHVHTWFKV